MSTSDLIEVELFQVNAFVTNEANILMSIVCSLILVLFLVFSETIFFFCFELNYLSEAYNIEYIYALQGIPYAVISFSCMAEVKNKDTVVKYACKNRDFTYENHTQIGRSAVTYEIFKRQWEKSRQKKTAKTNHRAKLKKLWHCFTKLKIQKAFSLVGNLIGSPSAPS